ncbi:MAG: lysylphosphatidylglycerol synthase transmembrane domain-containing protein [Schlesneria sp.]
MSQIDSVITSENDDEPVDQKTQLSSYWPVVKLVVFVIVLAFIGRRAFQLWKLAPPKSIQINAWWLIPAALSYLIGWFPSIWFWRATLRHLQQPLDWWTAIRAYHVGQIGKYVPGKAMVLIIRGSLTKSANVNPVLAGVTAAYESLVFIATGAMLGLALAPSALGPTFSKWLPIQLNWLQKQPLLWPVVVIIATFATTPISSWLFTIVGRKVIPGQKRNGDNPPSISAGLISQGIVVMTLGWICHAFSLGFVLQSLSNARFKLTLFPVWLASASLSLVGGFLVLIAPGGIGVREGILVEALKDHPEIGPATALIAAGLLRVVWFVTELIAAAVLFLAKTKRQSLSTDSSD